MAICKNCNCQYEGDFCPQCGVTNELKVPIVFLQEQEQLHLKGDAEENTLSAESQKTKKKKKSHALLGFRTDKIWKKIVSVLYLLFCMFFVIGVFSDFKTGKITAYDIIIEKLSGIANLLIILSPYIFLSNTKFRDKLPLFKKHRAGLSLVGMIIVVSVLFSAWSLIENLHSNEYKADMLNHAYVITETKDANCTEQGHIKRTCEYCSGTDYEYFDALGHDLDSKRICKRCGIFVEETTTTTTKPKEEKTKQNKNNINFVENEKTNAFIISALKECNIDPKKVKDFKQIEDWAYGTRYTFSYNGLYMKVYCNSDGSINSINLGENKIYDQGYEAYNVNDFVISSGVETQLIIMTEDYVNGCLKYPESADYKTFEWGFGRNHNIYFVSGKVEAPNAFGVKDTIYFEAKYIVENEKIRLIYLNVDGVVVIDATDEVATTERKKTE